jgi:hypothetical protein
MPKLTQEDINYLNMSITNNEMAAVRISQQRKARTKFTTKFYQFFKEETNASQTSP